MVDRGKIELTDSGWRRCKTEKPTKKKAKRESEKMGRMKDLGITIPGDHHPGTRRSFLVHIEVHEIDKHGLHGLMEVPPRLRTCINVNFRFFPGISPRKCDSRN